MPPKFGTGSTNPNQPTYFNPGGNQSTPNIPDSPTAIVPRGNPLGDCVKNSNDFEPVVIEVSSAQGNIKVNLNKPYRKFFIMNAHGTQDEFSVVVFLHFEQLNNIVGGALMKTGTEKWFGVGPRVVSGGSTYGILSFCSPIDSFYLTVADPGGSETILLCCTDDVGAE